MRVSLEIKPGQMMPDLSAEYLPNILHPAGAFALATYRHSKLPLRLFEAARIATAVINGCIVCCNWRAARDVTYLGVETGVIHSGPEPDEAFYKAVLSGDYSVLTRREMLAVQYVKKIGVEPRELAQDEAFWADIKAVLSDEEIVDLTYCAAAWIGLGRATHVLGVDTACAVPTHQAEHAA